MTTLAASKMTNARTALILDQPFFGALALRLALVPDPKCKTAATNGVVIKYNPDWIATLSHPELMALVAHEVMHCASGHPWRRSGRNPKKWNHACDYAINGELVEAKFTLPKGGLLDPMFSGHASEWIYDRIPDGGEGEGGDGDDDSGPGNPQGEVEDAPADAADDSNTEADWQKAVQQAAAAAQARGNLPASLKRFADQAAAPRVDWKAALRRFVQQSVQNDYTWRTPSRRYIAQGLYMPSLHGEAVGPVAVVVDTSGSIDDVTLSQFKSEMQSIADEVQPAQVHVIYADAAVNSVDVFERNEPIEMKAVGGGGTDFRPAFKHVAKMEEQPVCVVYLTDMYGSFPEQAPDVPTFWASTTAQLEGPFGETVYVGQ